ncbi:flagellar biosynthesis component FlhA [Pseudomonas frederiksbergensis]
MDRSQLINSARTNVADLSWGNLSVPLLLLDVFFTFNIALSIVVLLVCVYALRPLDFCGAIPKG